MDVKQPLVSVVLSFRNEEEVIPELVRRLRLALEPLPVRYELVFVNDLSSDNSLALLCDLHRQDARIKIVNTARRCGVSQCTMAGFRYARGDAVIYMDTDLQDPPELIPEMIAKWQEGADTVYTVRRTRVEKWRAKTWVTHAAYCVINTASEVELPVDAGDFKLLSRRVVNEVLKLGESDPYLRGLVTWVGFKQVPVYYDRELRAAGVTHFPLLRSAGPVATFVSGLTSFSLSPLVFFLLLGLTLTVLGTGAIAALGLLWWRGVILPENIGWYVALDLAVGVQLLAIGTLGLYVGRVYKEVRQRPNYTISDTIGFEDDA